MQDEPNQDSPQPMRNSTTKDEEDLMVVGVERK